MSSFQEETIRCTHISGKRKDKEILITDNQHLLSPTMCRTLKSCMYILLQVDFKSTDLISYNSQMHKYFFPMRMIIAFRSPYLKEKRRGRKKRNMVCFYFSSFCCVFINRNFRSIPNILLSSSD